jgi:aminoglycoside phosphotransferase family enzyme/predicted kinase
MKFLRQLLNPVSFDHPVVEIELLETHISWIILTGEYAYKIKKPVNLGFLDFSTLEKRRYYCNEEIRLNKRLAPQIYLKTVAFTGNEASIQIDGTGPILEYAVKMRQFRQQDQFDRLLKKNLLYREDIQHLAVLIAEFHQSAQVVSQHCEFGDPAHIYDPIKENFRQINQFIEGDNERNILTSVAAWSASEFSRLTPYITERKKNGFVRECHGDMHLRNIAKFQNNIVIFDCIEFNPNLRWIDVISEIAFIEMDLHDRGRIDYANILLNTYLQSNGDYRAMQLLRFYLVYRAMVRAKVDCIRAYQDDVSKQEKSKILLEFSHYLNLAHRFTQPTQAALIITCGLSGCGKTYITDQLMEYLPFVRLRSDVERKRLFDLSAHENSQSSLGCGIYTQEATTHTYQRLLELSRLMLSAGWSVLVDASFLHAEQRDVFRGLADELGASFIILHLTAPSQVLSSRIRRRQQTRKDASEADLSVLQSQIDHQEPPSAEETCCTIEVDSGNDVDISLLAHRIQHLSQN